MTSLSNIYRYSAEKELKEKPIKLHRIEHPSPESESHSDFSSEEDRSALAEDVLSTAKEQAEQLLRQAEQEAQQIQENAQRSNEQAHEDAKATGFQQGYEDGLTKAESEYSSIIQEANEVVERTKADYRKKLADAEEDILMLSVKIAEKIINRTFEEDDDAFIQLVKDSILEVSEQPEVHLYVHPSAYEQVSNHRIDLESILSGKGQLSIYSNQDLSVNACMIESPFGKIDASLDTQLNRIKEGLIKLVKENQ